ncbi:MAG: rRNA maturation RNase YbeY [bacterium]|nr:rRNA maturation RNase YbeY [bacterium]
MEEGAVEPGTVQVHWSVESPAQPASLPDGRLGEVVAAALAHGKYGHLSLGLVFVSDETLTSMHSQYLSDATPTDVITFDLGEEDPGLNGELYISVDCAQRLAAERRVSFERELALYVVHGTLHLCGFDDHDPNERAEMRKAEAVVMGELGFEIDSMPHE